MFEFFDDFLCRGVGVLRSVLGDGREGLFWSCVSLSCLDFFGGGSMFSLIMFFVVEVFFGGDGVSSFVRLRCDRPIY